ncbi:hypothetical protein K493DRAFT_319235 [Basidiobolus meristosporus CBS 931.73]|uniref:RING-type domain-containing protein n=1 Tax=Basidiobolus meristosporus CBS 931.73 TaxID=1314790 RepID=A0A1Y1XSP6_9FUNG|nr:hypothetical protein K493DRAFT_319235 [Basidiobolus meristosporus CBS 931.73]|eukprot:ORX88758.1 hypothetical protein K493DRAFT_319235 [Basidiobolus meristosporus CBS 931.73]
MSLTTQTIFLIPVIAHPTSTRLISANCSDSITRSLVSRYSNLVSVLRRYDLCNLEKLTVELPRVLLESPLVAAQPCCAICQENFLTTAHPIVETPCHHVFHEHCISPWFKKCDTCPICRLRIEPNSRFPAHVHESRQNSNSSVIACGHCHVAFVEDQSGESSRTDTITLIGCQHQFHKSCLRPLAITEQSGRHSYVKCPSCRMEHLVKTCLLSLTNP